MSDKNDNKPDAIDEILQTLISQTLRDYATYGLNETNACDEINKQQARQELSRVIRNDILNCCGKYMTKKDIAEYIADLVRGKK